MAEADGEFLLFLSRHGNLEREYLFVCNNGADVEIQQMMFHKIFAVFMKTNLASSSR